jgi:hypothetical protein
MDDPPENGMEDLEKEAAALQKQLKALQEKLRKRK